jgi:hypothetical protein
MNRRLFWSIVVVSLLLKWVGASWDVASHFRTTQDTANPAHLVNLAGNFLLAGALFAQWRGHRPEERNALMACITGLCCVGLAVPLDIAWHKVHGLDLTTWSPTHMFLFYGTAFACAGLVALLLAHVGWSWKSAAPRPRLGAAAWLLLTLLLARTLAPLLFPASFNEFAVVAAENLRTGQSIYSVDATLVDFAAKFHDLPYADLPHALYPTYTLAMSAAFFVAVRRMSRTPGLALGAATVYVLGRLIPDLVMQQVGFPVSAVPYHVLGVAFAVELAWLAPVGRLVRSAIAGALGTGLAYAFWSWPSVAVHRVPLDWAAAPLALAGSVLAAGLAATLPARPFLAAGHWFMRLAIVRWFVRLATWRPARKSPSPVA